jgi:superfamily II DNA or RNA helicase
MRGWRLSSAVLSEIAWAGMTPRRWQKEALDAVMASLRTPGNSPLVVAATGGGKSHLLAAVCRLAESKCGPKDTIVVSTPTQNLVRQLSKTIASRCKSVGVYYGDRKQPDRTIVVTCNPSLLSLAIDLAALGKTVRGLVCDEAHSSESPTLQAAVPAFMPKWRIGLTATPFRSDDAASLSLWTNEAYRYRLGDALEDGVLVPWRIDRYRRDITDTDPDADETDRLCADWIGAQSGPGVVSARSIADATAYAEVLRARGIAAAPIHSELPAKAIRELLLRWEASAEPSGAYVPPSHSSPLSCLVHVSMLAEGVDFPFMRWIVLRRPVSSAVRVVQEFGRVLRAHPGKSIAHVYDPHGVVTKLDREAALGRALDDGVIAEERKLFRRGAIEIPVMPRAKAVDEATEWTTALMLAVQSIGFASKWDDEKRRTHETMPSTPGQKDMLCGRSESDRGLVYFARYLPESVRESVKALCEPDVVPGLQYGAASDLISVLAGMREVTKESRQSLSGARRAAGVATGAPKYFSWPKKVAFSLSALDASAIEGLRVVGGVFDWASAPASSAVAK